MFLTKRKNIDLDDNISNKNKKIKENYDSYKILPEKLLLKKKYDVYFIEHDENIKRTKLNHKEDYINPYFLDFY